MITYKTKKSYMCVYGCPACQHILFQSSPMKYVGCSKCNATDRGQQLQAPSSLRSRERRAHAWAARGLGAVQLQGQTRSQNSGVRQPAGSLPALGRVKPQAAGPPRSATATAIAAWGRCQPSVLNGRR